MQPRLAAVAMLLLAGAPACSDPVRTHDIDALGGEQPGIPAGPLHRAGQPCVLCHGGDGPGGAVFSFGGTVYQDKQSLHPLPDALVRFIDSNGVKYQVATNCVGNFFVMKDDYSPAFPVWVHVYFGEFMGQPVPAKMGSAIYREGSCAKCHAEPASTESAGHVFWSPNPITVPTTGCP